jgi:hypothetical protein
MGEGQAACLVVDESTGRSTGLSLACESGRCCHVDAKFVQAQEQPRDSGYSPDGTTLPFTVTSTWPVFGLYSIMPCSKFDTSRSPTAFWSLMG